MALDRVAAQILDLAKRNFDQTTPFLRLGRSRVALRIAFHVHNSYKTAGLQSISRTSLHPLLQWGARLSNMDVSTHSLRALKLETLIQAWCN